MNPLLAAALGSILRAALAGAAGYLVNQGIWTADAADQYLAAAVLAILTVAWSLWVKYKDRIKFLTALESPAGTTEAKVDATIKTGMGATLTVLVLAVAIGSLSLAGCGPKAKPVLVKADAAVYESVRAIHQTAIMLGTNRVITASQELAIQQALLPVSRLGEQITRVLIAWQSGPTPPELVQLVRELGKLTTEIVNVLPGEAQGKAALLERIAAAQQAIATILMLMTGGAS
jgi:hypothetical protein